MSNESATVYNVQINGQKRKAFDAIALKQYLEGKKLYYSILSLNPDNIDNDESMMAYIAKSATETLAELELAIDEALGLVSPRENADLPANDKSEERNAAENESSESSEENSEESSEEDEGKIDLTKAEEESEEKNEKKEESEESDEKIVL